MGLHRKNNPVPCKLEGARGKKRDSQLAKHPRMVVRKTQGMEPRTSPPCLPTCKLGFLKACRKQGIDIDNPQSKDAWQPKASKGGPIFQKGGSKYPRDACLSVFCLVFIESGMLIGVERWSFKLLLQGKCFNFLLNKVLNQKIPLVQGWLSPSTQLAKLCAPSIGMNLIP